MLFGGSRRGWLCGRTVGDGVAVAPLMLLADGELRERSGADGSSGDRRDASMGLGPGRSRSPCTAQEE